MVELIEILDKEKNIVSAIKEYTTSEFLNKIKSIESDALEVFPGDFQSDKQYLYEIFFGERFSLLLSSIHHYINLLLQEINSRIKRKNFHYTATSSRNLIACIDIVERLLKISELKNTGFIIDKEYGEVLNACKGFLVEYGGSTIPTNMKEIEIKFELPIFLIGDTISKKNGAFESIFKLQPIGKGAYAQVYKYYDDYYDKYFAIKRADKNLDDKMLERFYKEYEVMKSLNSPYVLEVYRLDKNANEYVMELADFSLYKYISKNNQKLGFTVRRKICLQIIKAFEFLDGMNILHRDISPRNILIKKYQKEVVVKIADFGLVKTIDSQLTSLDTDIRGYFNDISGLNIDGFMNYNKQYEYYALSKLIYFVLTGRYKNMTKYDFPNLKEFMERGVNPNHSCRYRTIDELKKAFLKIQEQ